MAALMPLVAALQSAAVEEQQKRVKKYLEDTVYKRDKKGLLIIIDQTTNGKQIANSNERDIRKITETFQPLGFHIHNDKEKHFHNLKSSEVTSRFHNIVRKYNDENEYDCLFVFILSFSYEKNYVVATGGDYEIEKLFESIQKYFVNKPKVFFFRTPVIDKLKDTRQADTTTFEVVGDDSDDDGNGPKGKGTAVVIPQRADYLVVINSQPFEKVEGSETELRSDFIDNLTDYITENSTKDAKSIKDLMSILTRVQAKLSESKQWDQKEGMMPFRLTYSTLTKKLILRKK